MNYHLKNIPRGELGESSKIQEELLELIDAEEQDCKIMMLIELADLFGAINAYLDKNFKDVYLEDLHKFAQITKRTFTSDQDND